MITKIIIAWVIIHIGVSVLVSQLPASMVLSFSKLYQLKKWERNGRVYERLKIRKWKHVLPEARKWVNQGKGKTAVQLRNEKDFQALDLQTSRSELSHWAQILPSPLFFFFLPVWAGWVMILYAILFNMPFIIVQRYNRSRLERFRKIYQKKQR
ncbi:glycosyl-4,4'-diaponeurosporenoate acyltransferase CrtO family protein [Halobacillus sp. K22]|uniref:glycosyl-4,4'-diaponeurosporenoate acyltransferase CrtO family protein n=1 Tax=Halobacillus sp. K22 TaxID=3457431 RepID=UPI003FCE8B1B